MSLMNSKELEFMTSNGLIQDVSLRFGVIGAGQKGNKDADIFAGYRFADGTQCYPTLAINFAQADMIHLKNIPEKDRIHFDGMKGAARTPSLVVELFDPTLNPKANELRSQLAAAMEKKFANVEHLIISLGAGGGVGTGWGSLTLNLIKEGFFPVPITLLISLPIDDPDEIANALLLLKEIQDFLKIQEELFEYSDTKPLASVILTDNKKIYHDFELKKGSRTLQHTNLSWKDEGNNAVISTIHEANLIPANFGSDNVTYDPSDFIKLMQLSGKLLTMAKARLEPDFTIEKLEAKMRSSIEKGYFACGHQYQTATMYGGFILRPSNADFFKDVITERTIKKVISDYNPITQMRGKFGDPIWNENYAVIYTFFAGMGMPSRFAELATELQQIKEKQEQVQQESELDVDVSAAIKNVKQSTFNPYQPKTNKFGGGGFGGGFQSVFSRSQSAVTKDDENQKEKKEEQPNRFGQRPGNRFDALRKIRLHENQ
ncbi:cell division protein FtsZ [Brevibacillus sp. FSL K6-2834]|uniref:cell division protein FtsZ n=1 Tax=Brevibacillus sp. FSL K6-2834 TaxID=2954680 RepID=UPI00315823AF